MEDADALVPVKERAKTAVAVLCGQRGYIDEDGERDATKIGDHLLPFVAQAKCDKRIDRPETARPRRSLVEHCFPGLPGPENWSEQEDPELARETYAQIDSIVWRLCDTRPGAYLQAQLNSNDNLVLCRTKVNPHQTDAVYVTRDKACILEDIVQGMLKRQKTRADADAALSVMLVDRVPEYARVWERSVISGLKQATEATRAQLAGPMAAAEIETGDGLDEVDGE